LVREFPDAALGLAESFWKPERAKLPAGVEHAHWDWARKIGTPMFEFVAVVAHSQVEGLAAVARSGVQSLLTPAVTATYLAYLETAPWNHELYPGGGRYTGVGTALLEEAVLTSLAAGCGGRVQLTALPQAEDFYRRKGMTEVGPTGSGGLVYFEYTEAAALVFLTSRGVTI